MKVFITRPIPFPVEKRLKEEGFEVFIGKKNTGFSKNKLISLLKKNSFDVMITFLNDPIEKEVIDAFCKSGNAKLIANYATGIDNIDINYATKKGLKVINTIYDPIAVSEFASGLIIASNRYFLSADSFVRNGKFKTWDPNIFIGYNLKGKTLGIIGVGHIGFNLSLIMNKGYGLNIIYYDLEKNNNLEKECNAKFVDLKEIFKNSDFISIHTPLSSDTHHLVSKDLILTMKREAVIINTSRGPVIDEEFLIEALEDNLIRGAALDVFEFEPKISRKLKKLPNVILTPHIASATLESRQEMSVNIVENIINNLNK